MPGFDNTNTTRDPFGKNEYRRSTKGLQYESYTCAQSTIPTVTVDGVAKKVLQSGTVMAKITSGADSGKVGPYLPDATDGRQTTDNIVGINDTYLPWQMNDDVGFDREIAVCYVGTLVQAWCLEINASDVAIALTDDTRDAMVSNATLGLIFR